MMRDVHELRDKTDFVGGQLGQHGKTTRIELTQFFVTWKLA